MDKKDYVDFIKNYTLSAVYFIIYLPRLIIAGLLVLIPFYFVAVIIFYILSAKAFSLDGLLNFFENFITSMDHLSFFDQIGFWGISFSTLYFTCGNNFYGRIVRRIWPLENKYRNYD